MKDYTTICASAPSEFLTALALRNRHVLLDRNLAIVRHNLPLLDGYATVAQRKWAIWTTKQQLSDQLPDEFAEVLRAVIAFADPAHGFRKHLDLQRF